MALAAPLLYARAESVNARPGVIALHSSGPMWWTFILSVDAWQADGRVPGGFLASIDKLDGQIWTDGEQEEWHALVMPVADD